jgi:hypothetical protein
VQTSTHAQPTKIVINKKEEVGEGPSSAKPKVFENYTTTNVQEKMKVYEGFRETPKEPRKACSEKSYAQLVAEGGLAAKAKVKSPEAIIPVQKAPAACWTTVVPRSKASKRTHDTVDAPEAGMDISTTEVAVPGGETDEEMIEVFRPERACPPELAQSHFQPRPEVFKVDADPELGKLRKW